MSSLAVVNCAQVLTLAGPARPRVGAELRELGLISGGALFISEGKIAAAAPRSEIERLIDKDTEVVDAGGRVVLPGFVDAHTHPVFAGNRAGEYEQRIEGATYAEIAARGGGIRSTVRQTRAASSHDLACSLRHYANWFLRGGTTTIEAKSGYGLSVESELKMLRTIRQADSDSPVRFVPTFLGAHEVPDEYRGRIDDYVGLLVDELLPLVAHEKLAKFCDVFCEPNVFPYERAAVVLRAAKSLGLGLRLHADQFTADYGAQLAAELCAATADHLEQTSDAGCRALQAAGVQPVLLPASVYALGLTRYPAARRMIELGMPVVLATDFNPGSSPTTSMAMVLSLACTQMKMTPAEGIAAATVNAAYTLKLGGQIGSLEPGKMADFCIHDCGDYREIPYFFARETAWQVYRSGVCVFGPKC
jgi:imidazolonepropionase